MEVATITNQRRLLGPVSASYGVLYGVHLERPRHWGGGAVCSRMVPVARATGSQQPGLVGCSGGDFVQFASHAGISDYTHGHRDGKIFRLAKNEHRGALSPNLSLSSCVLLTFHCKNTVSTTWFTSALLCMFLMQNERRDALTPNWEH